MSTHVAVSHGILSLVRGLTCPEVHLSGLIHLLREFNFAMFHSLMTLTFSLALTRVLSVTSRKSEGSIIRGFVTFVGIILTGNG